MSSPDPWTDEPDRPSAGKYRRIYDANGVSVARVYDPADSALIAQAPAMRDFLRTVIDDPNCHILTNTEARRLFRLAGGRML
jgi:hypothetical protein